MRRMSRAKFYLLPFVLILVVVATYYFMFSSPRKTTRNNAQSNTVSWTQRKINRPGETRGQIIYDRFNQKNGRRFFDKLTKNDASSRKEAFGDGDVSNPQDQSRSQWKPLQRPENSRIQENIPVMHDLWRINNASKYYGKRSSQSNFFKKNLQKIIHLDLKGAPPKMEYIRKLFPFFKRLGATGLLIEYEDVFPFTEDLHFLTLGDHYTENDVKEILQLAADNDLKVIPLIQTFGHMEYVLKYEKYANLRDVSSSPFVITPVLDSAYSLIQNITKQVLALHPDAEYVHIGCDEVYQLGDQEAFSNSLVKEGKTVHDIFLNHVAYVARKIREIHKKEVIIWDDMLRKIDLKKLEQYRIGDLVEPMVWDYNVDVLENAPPGIWSKYAKIFDGVWAASAFKGATGSSQIMTDVSYHLRNHLNWIKLIDKLGPGNPDQGQSILFRGIALTGWQRYDHFSHMCELLPAGTPSLAVCLLSVSNGGFDESVHQKASQALGCESMVHLVFHEKDAADVCKFPGSDLYLRLRKLWFTHEKFSSIKQKIEGRISQYHLTNQFFNPKIVQVTNSSLIDLKRRIKSDGLILKDSLLRFYRNSTASEWIKINIDLKIEDIDKELDRLKVFPKKVTWIGRPGYSIDNDNKVDGKASLPSQGVLTLQNKIPVISRQNGLFPFTNKTKQLENPLYANRLENQARDVNRLLNQVQDVNRLQNQARDANRLQNQARDADRLQNQGQDGMRAFLSNSNSNPALSGNSAMKGIAPPQISRPVNNLNRDIPKMPPPPPANRIPDKSSDQMERIRNVDTKRSYAEKLSRNQDDRNPAVLTNEKPQGEGVAKPDNFKARNMDTDNQMDVPLRSKKLETDSQGAIRLSKRTDDLSNKRGVLKETDKNFFRNKFETNPVNEDKISI